MQKLQKLQKQGNATFQGTSKNASRCFAAQSQFLEVTFSFKGMNTRTFSGFHY